MPAGNPLAGHTPIGSYVYHADMAGDYGDNYVWVDGWGAEARGGLLARERWYSLEVYVRMNTPGANDGVLRAWVDGHRSLDEQGMRFRDVDTLKIERVWMNVYHGGTATSPAGQHLFIDHVVVARSYIGPMTGAPEAEPATGAPGDAGARASDAGAGTSVSGSGGGGSTDSGASRDTAPTAPTGADAGAVAPAASSGDDGGCGCRVARRPGTAEWALMLATLAALGRRRR